MQDKTNNTLCKNLGNAYNKLQLEKLASHKKQVFKATQKQEFFEKERQIMDMNCKNFLKFLERPRKIGVDTERNVNKLAS